MLKKLKLLKLIKELVAKLNLGCLLTFQPDKTNLICKMFP